MISAKLELLDYKDLIKVDVVYMCVWQDEGIQGASFVIYALKNHSSN